MNINLIKFKGVVRELSGIRYELKRIADCYEMQLALKDDIRVHVDNVESTQAAQESVEYEDETLAWAREEYKYSQEMLERAEAILRVDNSDNDHVQPPSDRQAP